MKVGIVTIINAEKKDCFYVKVSFGYVHSCDKYGIYSFCQKLYGALQFETREEALYVCNRVYEQSPEGHILEWVYNDDN